MLVKNNQMAQELNHEGETIVSFLGPGASYTHQAALTAFPQNTHPTFHSQTTIADIFASVQTRKAHYGLVPIENSTNGAVNFTLDFFARDLLASEVASTNSIGNSTSISNSKSDVLTNSSTPLQPPGDTYPDVIVCAEVFVAVRHCLLGRKSHLLSNSSTALGLGRITKLYSHPQAWGQCERFLASEPLKHAIQEDVSSTSQAAAKAALHCNTAAHAKDGGGAAHDCVAAVSSELAADLYGLDVLASAIQDDKSNATRFFVLVHRERSGETFPSPHLGIELGTGERRKKRRKSLLLFTISSYEEPGALADALAVFKAHGVTLTSINARPAGRAGRGWEYVFFVEVSSHAAADEARGVVALDVAEDDERGGGEYQHELDRHVRAAMRDLNRVARSWRWLGSWDDVREDFEREQQLER